MNSQKYCKNDLVSEYISISIYIYIIGHSKKTKWVSHFRLVRATAKTWIDSEPRDDFRFRKKRDIELWNFGQGIILLHHHIVTRGLKWIVNSFTSDFDAFISIQWVIRIEIMSDSVHFAIENTILWQNKAFVMAWQHFSHFRLPKPP